MYISKINERLQAHFETAVDYCLSRLDTVTAEVGPEEASTLAQADRNLSSAAVREGFSAVSLMGEDGLLETVSGGRLMLLYPDKVYDALASGQSRIGIGRMESREGQVEVCAVPAQYPMQNDKRSIAVLGVLNDNFLRNILTLDVEGSQISSYIVRPDGSYVLRTDTYGQSYYADVMDRAGTHVAENEQYIEQLRDALSKDEQFQGTFYSDGVQTHVLATPLVYSQWVLLTEMPDGALTQAVGDLGSDAVVYALIACAIVLGCIAVVFFGYYKISRAQIAQIEEARAEADRANKAKSEFFSNMSHDIRTPMNAIVGMTSIAMSRLDNKDAVKNSLQKISISSKQLLGLINDVLDMSRIESGNLKLRMEPMSLREFMDSVVSIIQPQIAAKRQTFDVYVDNVSVENVYCDAVRLNQVLLNLLANAVKFTPEGGRITLAMYETPSNLGEGYVTVNIDVADSGIGMSKDFQEKIYESFAREEVATVQRTEGVGLGMAITKHIVDAMQGTIELQSAQGEGSRFHITLNLEKAQSAEEELSLPPVRVLVIDDDAQVGEGARAALQSLGVRADTVLDGKSGIERLKDASAAKEPYDVVLVDWKLPFMNGVQTSKRIHEEISDDTPLLLMSAYDWADVEDEALAAGIDGFLAKPLFKSTLYNGLLSVLGDIPKTKSDKKRLDFTGKRLLVAEDNDINWEIMQTLLAQNGFSLDRAADGSEAVHKFRSSPNGYYDAILMDVHMPVLNGLDATQQIRAMADANREDANLPIIAMTADAFADDIRRSMDSGMNAHISKPIDIDEMLRKLAQLLKP